MAKPILTESQKKKKFKGLCIIPYCKKKHGYGRNICYSCMMKIYIKNHPLEYVYITKKSNAKKKKKYFALTFEEFKIFVGDTDYMRKRGTSAKSLQMDRKEECIESCPPFCKKHGYYFDNIQAITLRENRYKYARHKGHDFSKVPF